MSLKLENVSVCYGQAQALHTLSMEVAEGEIVVIMGANGAGKTTTLRAISGLQPILAGGTISFNGQNLSGRRPDEITKLGIALVPEGRQVFTSLTVLDNLRIGGYLWRRDQKRFRQTLERVLNLFPRLQERQPQLAGTLSGGEQQMLAIGRALMSRPRLLMLDEPSLGLAPVIVRELFEFLEQLHREEGLTILLVEQAVAVALKFAQRGYVLERGQLVLSGEQIVLSQYTQLQDKYLGKP